MAFKQSFWTLKNDQGLEEGRSRTKANLKE